MNKTSMGSLTEPHTELAVISFNYFLVSIFTENNLVDTRAIAQAFYMAAPTRASPDS
jgi:hypothetical protein